MLTDEQLLAWWRLGNVAGLGNIARNHIRSHLPSTQALVQCTAQDLIAMGVKQAAALSWQQDAHLSHGFDVLLHWRQQPDCGVLLAGVAPYPEILSSLPDAPIILYYQGQLEALQRPMVAMVGSRHATPYALDWTYHTAKNLAAQRITVVSGLALGVDAAAHAGAVETGCTIAVQACGLDQVYPLRHQSLAQKIRQQGLILSEFPLGTPPLPRQFPSRNRIVSGLSLGTVVVEAAVKSGSLITAKLAADQGREVFALPGAVTNPLSHGCHQLIRDGAILVQSSDDILQELRLSPSVQPAVLVERLQADANTPALLQHIDFTATTLDVIAERSGLSMAQLLPELLALELDHWLVQVPNGYQRQR